MKLRHITLCSLVGLATVLALAVLLGMLLSLGTTATAQVSKKVTSQAVPSADSMAPFWQKFRAAVITGDKEAVAALSRFPIARGYGMASLKNKAQLMKHYREVFFGETNAAVCFPKAKPFVEKGRPKEFTIGCSFRSDGGNEEPFVYTFTLTRNGWRFTGFENINE